ncbi:hypothetical protein ACFL6C_10535 [Myxococcota bacterium]
MRLKLGALLVCSVTACESGSLQIWIDVPERYASHVVSATLGVFESPAAQPFTCSMIAFGLVSEADVASHQVRFVSIEGTRSEPLTGLDRTRNKVLWAKGHDQDGEVVTMACREIGEVDTDQPVRLLMEPTVSLELAPSAGSDEVAGGGTIRGRLFTAGTQLPAIVMRAVDAVGEPAADIEIQWSLVGPADADRSGNLLTDDGAAALSGLDAPALAGPFSIGLHARWQRHETVRINAAVEHHRLADWTFQGNLFAIELGSIGPTGEPGFIATIFLAADRIQLVVGYYADNGNMNLLPSVEVPFLPDEAPVLALGLLRDNTPGRDQPFLISSERWLRVTITDHTQPPRLDDESNYCPHPGHASCPPYPQGPVFALPAQTCDTDGSDCHTVLVVLSDGSLRTYCAADGLLTSNALTELPTVTATNCFENFVPLASGCVSDPDGIHRRTIVGTNDHLDTCLVAAGPDGLRAFRWLTLVTSVGFDPTRQFEPSLLAGFQLLGNDLGLSLNRLAFDGDELSLQPTFRQPTPGTILQSQVANIDGDTHPDIVSSFVSIDLVSIQQRLFAMLGKELHGERVAAPMGFVTLENPVVHAIDFNRDGFDDLLVGEAFRQDADLATVTSQIQIEMMGPAL